MRIPCVGKNINLSKFGDAIEVFFTNQDYQTSRHTIRQGYYILGRPTSSKDDRPAVAVVVTGQPNDFMIDFQPVEATSSDAALRMGVSFFGTFPGLELKKKFDRQDQFVEFEKQFWKHVLDAIADLKET